MRRVAANVLTSIGTRKLSRAWIRPLSAHPVPKFVPPLLVFGPFRRDTTRATRYETGPASFRRPSVCPFVRLLRSRLFHVRRRNTRKT